MFDDFKCYLCEKLLSLNMLAHVSVCHELLEELIETIVKQDCEHGNMETFFFMGGESKCFGMISWRRRRSSKRWRSIGW